MSAAGDITSAASDFELCGCWRTPSAFRVRIPLASRGPLAEKRFVDVDAEFARLGRDAGGSNAEALPKLQGGAG